MLACASIDFGRREATPRPAIIALSHWNFLALFGHVLK
jgi:hypothetical protein